MTDFLATMGASQAAAAADVHPYQRPITLWETYMRIGEPFTGNALTRWGQNLEGPIRDHYASLRKNSYVWTPREAIGNSEEWVRASPDGIVNVDGSGDEWISCENEQYGLEIKNTGHHNAHRWGDEGTDQVPIEYLVQCHWSMWVTGLKRWDLAVLIGGNDYREYTIEYDDEIVKSLVEKCSKFWHENVVKKVEPPVDDSDDYAKFLIRKYPHAGEEYSDSTPEINLITASLREKKQEIKRLGQEVKMSENILRDYIRENRGVETSEGRITYSTVTPKPKPDWELVCKHHVSPDMYNIEDFSFAAKPYRRFFFPRTWTAKK